MTHGETPLPGPAVEARPENAGMEAVSPQTAPLSPSRTKWPTVVGWLSIAVAAAWLIDAVVTVCPYLPNPEKDPFYHAFVIIIGVSAIPDLVLILAGVLLILRRPIARKLNLLYAWFTIILVIPGSAVLQTSASKRPLSAYEWTCAVLLIAYPIFLVWWFARPKVRHEIEFWRK